MKFYALLFFSDCYEQNEKHRAWYTSLCFYASNRFDRDALLEVWSHKYCQRKASDGFTLTESNCYVSTKKRRMERLILSAQGLTDPDYCYSKEQSRELIDEYDELIPPTPFQERDLDMP